MLFNDGVRDVFDVTLPEGTLLNPKFPAAVSNRLNVHMRFFDCMSGAMGQRAPDLAMAAGYGASPYFVFSGTDDHDRYFQFVELLFGGLPARQRGDGLDGHSWWPLFRTTPVEYTEAHYPVRVTSYVPVMDSGGAGLHRGGTGVEKTYEFLSAGVFTINDDRADHEPVGRRRRARTAAVARRGWSSATGASRPALEGGQPRRAAGRPLRVPDRGCGRVGRPAGAPGGPRGRGRP